MKVLSAKISPSVKVASEQKNVFQQPSIVDCPYMVAIARPYALGSDVTRFEIHFGIIETTPEPENKIITTTEPQSKEVFRMQTGTNVELTKEELASWGENDEACLNIIAQKLGTTIVGTKEVEV